MVIPSCLSNFRRALSTQGIEDCFDSALDDPNCSDPDLRLESPLVVFYSREVLDVALLDRDRGMFCPAKMNTKWIKLPTR